MKVSRAARLAVIALASQVLIGCGASNTAFTPVSPSYSSLIGDWYISGNLALKQFPVLAVTLIVDGNQITAQGGSWVGCSTGTSAVGGGFNLSGQVASDGTFQLSEPAGNLSSIQIAITGSVPAAGQSTWSGTYTITDLPGYTSCLVNQTASFAAVQFAPLNVATYAGTLTSQFGSVNVSTTLTQGPVAVFTPLRGTPFEYMPLAGTISISSPCNATGASTTAINRIEGDGSSLSFTMNDGSTALFNGEFGSYDESTMQFVSIAIRGGPCDGQGFGGVLTRQ
jgi:hypothetical protein